MKPIPKICYEIKNTSRSNELVICSSSGLEFITLNKNVERFESTELALEKTICNSVIEI